MTLYKVQIQFKGQWVDADGAFGAAVAECVRAYHERNGTSARIIRVRMGVR